MERSTSLSINENSLESDMALVVRRMRQRQQDHRRFCEYNDKINSRWNELVDQIYIHDEISKLRAYIEDKLVAQQSQHDLDAQLSTRYQQIFTCSDPVFLLMRRVVTKVLQISQSAIDSMKQPVQYYTVTFNRFKTSCLRASSDAISCRPANILKIFSRYFHHKVIVQVDRLKEIIKCLQLSDCKGLETLKDAYYCKLTLKELSNPKRQVIISKELRSDSTSIASIKIVKKQVKPMQSEKQIRIKLSKNDEKQKQKHRKLEIKRLKKYIQSICEVMDVNKEQLLEDVFIDHKQSQSRRILTELNSRNKHNFTQIQMFVNKSKDAIIDPSILQVPVVVSSFIEKRNEESSSERVIAESTPQARKLSPSKNQREANSRYSRRDSLNTKPRNMYKQRKTVNNMEEVPAKQACHSEKVASQFVELNIKDQSSKQRFPQIYARATSVDNEKMQKKEMHLKLLKNQKINKEQLQLARAVQSSNQTFTSKKHFAEHVEMTSKEIKGREKIDSKIKLQLKTGTNFFEEIGKRISKFCEMKKNLKV